MTPHLRTFIDAIESAAGKRDASELTDIEKIALCFGNGIKLRAWTQPKKAGGDVMRMETFEGVEFIHDGGNWQVIELK